MNRSGNREAAAAGATRHRVIVLLLLALAAAACLLAAGSVSPAVPAALADEPETAVESADGPVTSGDNAAKYLIAIKGDSAFEGTALEDAVRAEDGPNTAARGHWIYEEIDTSTERAVPMAASEPGAAVAAAAVALSGYGRTGGLVGPSTGSSDKNRHTRPPNSGRVGNWTVYNMVCGAVPNNKLYTDCSNTVALAVRWSGVDDGFSDGSTVDQYRYCMASPKWQRVGGKGKYWHRKSGTGDAGVDVQPGDVLVGKPCETEGRKTHSFIYVGTEAADLKYPGAGYTIFESHMGRSWPGLQGNTPIPNATVDYCVFRRAGDVDVASSSWGGLYVDEKARYSIQQTFELDVSTERVPIAYVYDDYSISYAGLPEGASAPGRAAFAYDTATFPLADPLLPAGYVFRGWHLGSAVGPAIEQVPQGTMADIVVFADVTRDAIHDLETYRDMELKGSVRWGDIAGYLFLPLLIALVAAASVALRRAYRREESFYEGWTSWKRSGWGSAD